jgi:hypothetical protein
MVPRMQGWISTVLVLAVACGNKQPPPPANEFEAFERKYVAEYEALAKALRADGREIADKDVPESYRAIYIGPPGVFIDRKLVATLADVKAKSAELQTAIDANAKLMPDVGYSGLAVTYDLAAQPASVAIDTLRLFVGRTAHVSIRREDPEIPLKASQALCSNLKLRGAPNADREAVQLSVLLAKGRIWVGLSRINEFQEVPDLPSERDFDKLHHALRGHKLSAFFAERNDIELAVETGTAGDVLAALELACRAGFVDIALVTPDQLSARPML